MAFPPLALLWKATWSGTIGADEIFSYSRFVTTNTSTDESFIDELADDVTAMLGQSVTGGPFLTLTSAFPSHVHWTQLKVSPWRADTNKWDPSRGDPRYVVLTDIPTGSTGSGMPYQIALAVTSRSTLAGRRKYNRFYLPTLVISATDGQGVLQSMVADAFAEWAALTITAGAAADDPVVYVNYNPGTTPTTHAIEDIYLGHRMDTIRRRRNQAPEGRTIATI